MTDQAHREAAIERLLRRALDVSTDAPAGPCPEPDVMAAYLESGLHDPERSAFEAHASTCRRCLESLAVLAELEPLPALEAEPAPARSWWRTLWPWMAPLAAAATVAVVYVAVKPASAPLSRGAFPDVQVADRGVVSVPAEQGGPLARQEIGHTTESVGTPESSGADAVGQTTETGRPGAAASPAKAEKSSRAKGVFAPEPLSAAPPAAPSAVPDHPAANVTQVPSKQDVAGAPGAQTITETAEAVPEVTPPAAPAPRARAAESVESADAMRKATVSNAASIAEAPPGAGAARDAQRLPLTSSPDQASFWRLRPAGVIERSADAGRTWRTLASGVASELLAASAVDANTCWVVGRAGVILWTGDGDRWVRVAPPVSADFDRVKATTAASASVTTVDGRSYRTDDGGRSWRQFQ